MPMIRKSEAFDGAAKKLVAAPIDGRQRSW
jgi:hypothetical protein